MKTLKTVVMYFFIIFGIVSMFSDLRELTGFSIKEDDGDRACVDISTGELEWKNSIVLTKESRMIYSEAHQNGTITYYKCTTNLNGPYL